MQELKALRSCVTLSRMKLSDLDLTAEQIFKINHRPYDETLETENLRDALSRLKPWREAMTRCMRECGTGHHNLDYKTELAMRMQVLVMVDRVLQETTKVNA
jgi:hypothetical protein